MLASKRCTIRARPGPIEADRGIWCCSRPASLATLTRLTARELFVVSIDRSKVAKVPSQRCSLKWMRLRLRLPCRASACKHKLSSTGP